MRWTLTALLTLQVMGLSTLLPARQARTPAMPQTSACTDVSGVSYVTGAVIDGRRAGFASERVLCERVAIWPSGETVSTWTTNAP